MNSLLNKQITDISCGDGVGSTFYLYLNNDKYAFGVFCTWRLCNKKVITSSLDSNVEFIPTGLSKLINLNIKKIRKNKFNDLVIKFNNGYELYIFCDLTQNIENYFEENWVLIDSVNGNTYLANKSGIIIVEDKT